MSHLYKKFVNERVLNLISNTERIRNCTVIAHIDHGKTTLTDSLIAASGLLSADVAAKARLLDYDQIEQQRGITIKASGISLIHKYQNQEFLIHLIDTPGHIDFSSHVTRGLRLTDGAVILVDVIEGIMVQTETVTRQAMQELVQPVLFLNKVDRLITEKRMDAKRVAEEISKVVREFNAMLGKYLDDERLEKWEVSFKRGSLCVGSALDKWAIGIEVIQEKAGDKTKSTNLSIAFQKLIEEIVEAYRHEGEKELAVKYPIAISILNSMVRTLPNPKVAQKYRIPIFWDGDLDSEAGKGLVSCDEKGPTVLLIGDVQTDRHAGLVAAGRVFSGTLRRAKSLRNLRTLAEGKSLQIGLFMSKTRVPHDEIPAGNLVFLSGIRDITTGDTLVDSDAKDIAPMKMLQYPTEPVVTYTIEPKKLSELDAVQAAILEYVNTDPALEFEINPETGEMLLSGAGELHVEITIEKLARTGVNVILGTPMVLLKEQITHDGEIFANEDSSRSQFTVQARTLSNDSEPSSLGTIIDSNIQSNCYLVDAGGKINTVSEEMQWILEAFRTVTRSGPLQGEKLRNLVIVIEKAKIECESMETSWRDITQPLVSVMRDSILSGEPVLLEPWIRLEIMSPEDHVGIISSILARRRGDISEIDSERALYKIIAEIPVRESFGLANEIRTETSGWATWGAKAGEYREIRPDEEEEVY
ncbi:MAG: GTP-binding protein [Candidatus Thorarchaeota archaeon]